MIVDAIQTENNLRVIFDDAAIGDLMLAAELNGAVSVHSAAVEAGDALAEMVAAQTLLALLGRLTKPARALILQNRDRSTPAMIAQMTQIASGPDYYRVAPTKEFASGTPIVFGNDNMLPRGAVIGRKDKAVSADGQRFAVRYVVVEAGDVLTSNKADGTAIPAYEGGAYGKLRAIAGNGRLAGLIASFERGTSAEYVRELTEDDSHGIAPEAIAKFAQPVLVRVMNQEDVTENIGDISNQRGTSDLSPVEQAQNDSKRLDLGTLDINDDGTPGEAAALAFIAAMPESERNNLMDGKRPGQKAYDRLMAAVFWKAYNDAELVRLYAQSVDPEVKTILGGMASASGDLAKLEGAGELDIRGLVSAAAALAVNAKRQGVKLSLFAQQADMTLDPDTMDVVRMFAENIRSAKKIGDRLRAAARFANEEFTKEDSDMFGEVEKASRAQVLAQLEKPVDVPESSLFDEAGDLIIPVASAASQPVSWLGYKIINQAAAEDMGASVLPSDKSLAGGVWCALTDGDGDPVYVAGIVVGVSFVASAVKYSVAFPIAQQPKEGVTLYAVVENIESGLVIDKLPDDADLFDAVLTEDAAKLLPGPAPAVDIFDAIDPLLELELSGKLIERTAALGNVDDSDPLAALDLSSEILSIIAQLNDDGEPAAPVAVVVQAVVPHEWTNLKADIISSMASIVGIDRGALPGMDRSLFVSSIAGKIRRQFTNGKLALAGTALAFVEYSQKAFPKPVFAPANKLWKDINWQDYAEQFETPAPVAAAAPKPAPIVKQELNMENYIKLAADSISQLRRIDVWRVLNALAADNIDGVTRADLAAYIATSRPDLAPEVAAVMAEEWPDLSWTLTAPAPAVDPVPAVAVEGNPAGLTDAEMVVLICTQGYMLKGRIEKATKDCGITKKQYDAGYKSLLEKPGYFNMGKITPEGTAIVRAFLPGMLANQKVESFMGKFASTVAVAANDHSELLVPAADGAPKELVVPPLPEAGEPPAANPQRDDDLAFLKSVVDRNRDMFADDIEPRIEAMGAAYPDDAELQTLWGNAITSYTNYMMEQMAAG
jgi:hypothetical protein